jgi:hypothetical protein
LSAQNKMCKFFNCSLHVCYSSLPCTFNNRFSLHYRNKAYFSYLFSLSRSYSKIIVGPTDLLCYRRTSWTAHSLGRKKQQGAEMLLVSCFVKYSTVENLFA